MARRLSTWLILRNWQCPRCGKRFLFPAQHWPRTCASTVVSICPRPPARRITPPSGPRRRYTSLAVARCACVVPASTASRYPACRPAIIFREIDLGRHAELCVRSGPIRTSAAMGRRTASSPVRAGGRDYLERLSTYIRTSGQLRQPGSASRSRADRMVRDPATVGRQSEPGLPRAGPSGRGWAASWSGIISFFGHSDRRAWLRCPDERARIGVYKKHGWARSTRRSVDEMAS